MNAMRERMADPLRHGLDEGPIFAACAPGLSLLEAIPEAAKCAWPGNLGRLSPAGSSFDRIRNGPQRGDVFRPAINLFVGVTTPTPPISMVRETELN